MTLNLAMGTIFVHNVETIRAESYQPLKNAEHAWLNIKLQKGDEVIEIQVYMLEESCQLYASAINACNDREAVDADESVNANI